MVWDLRFSRREVVDSDLLRCTKASLVGDWNCFGEAYYLHIQGSLKLEATLHRNVGNHIQSNTMQRTRRPQSRNWVDSVDSGGLQLQIGPHLYLKYSQELGYIHKENVLLL
jgi:hypothetical protein